MAAVPGPQPKLQLLADALAMEFSQSLASAQCAAALKRLLPGLEYLSIAVTNPAQPASIVSSANCAAEGPTTLHLHDQQSSVVGLALQRKQLLRGSLVGQPAAYIGGWTDMQQMAAAAPAATHWLCVPFGHSADVSSSDCELHCGSGCGALLFGLTAEPALDSRRALLLAGLAARLPAPMALFSGDTLAFVNLACGSQLQCTCCCEADSEPDEAAAAGDHPTQHAQHDGGDDDHSGPSSALRVPTPAVRDWDADAAGPSSGRASKHGKFNSIPGCVAAAAAAEGGAALVRGHHEGHAPLPFSKALLGAAAEDASITEQQFLTLAFRSPLAERAYGRWMAHHHLKGDIMTSVLLVTALIIVAFVEPYRLVATSPGSLALGLGVALPLCASWLPLDAYMPLRSWLLGAFRLYSVAFLNLVCVRTYQAHLASGRLQQWISFWRLTGAESLFITAMGFKARLALHLPLQLAALAVVVWNLPQMCTEIYDADDFVACFGSSAGMAIALGYIAPTVALCLLEQRSRRHFASRLQAAASHEA